MGADTPSQPSSAPLDPVAWVQAELPIDTARVLPHGPRVRLVDAVIAWSPEDATCVAKIRLGRAWTDRDGLQATALIEVAAQTAAAHIGVSLLHRGGAGAGMLISVREFSWHPQTPQLGEDVRCEVHRVGQHGGTAMYDVRLRWGAQGRAEGQLGVIEHLPNGDSNG